MNLEVWHPWYPQKQQTKLLETLNLATLNASKEKTKCPLHVKQLAYHSVPLSSGSCPSP